MPPLYLSFTDRRSLLCTAAILSLVIFWLVGNSWTRVGFAQAGPTPFRNFEAPFTGFLHRLILGFESMIAGQII